MKIGFIGTGVMGSRMVKRLLDAGHEVTVYNRTTEKVEPLVTYGAKKATDVIELAEQSPIICSCLSMPNDSLEVYFSENGVIRGGQPGTICIDFATIDPDTSRKINERAAERNISYLDAPVSGGPEGVEQGTLTIMVGGEKTAFDKIFPLLRNLGTKIEYLGPSGSGSVAKLINQYLVAVHSVAASEAMAAGAALGLNSEQLYSLLKVSYGNSRMLERHMENFVLDRRFQPGGAVKYVHKDVVLANKLFSQTGISEFLGQFAEKSFSKAMEKGLSEQDMSAVIQPLEEEAGVVVKRK